MGKVIEMEDYRWCPRCQKNVYTARYVCPRCGYRPLEETRH